ncbi:hypothetical protein T03_6541 [Trichinella britovi]|uniref:Uncharacterized protein n=1 Tax=Trichinella britovi TaxID=45882 RepID=A0A0V1CDN6_TRIBR|nr:hypothetical protein T03_6541 [Trichinella britovi]
MRINFQFVQMYHLKKYGSEKDENELCKYYSKSNDADVWCEMFSLLRVAKVCAVLGTTDMIYLVMMMWKNGKKEKTIMNEVKTFTDQPAPPGSTATLKRDVLEKMLGLSSKN